MKKLHEVADELGVSWSWLDKQVRAGKVKCVWLGGVRRIREEEVERIRREGVR